MDRAPATIRRPQTFGQAPYDGYERRTQEYVRQEDFQVFAERAEKAFAVIDEIRAHTRLVCKIAKALAAVVPVIAGLAATGHYIGFW